MTGSAKYQKPIVNIVYEQMLKNKSMFIPKKVNDQLELTSETYFLLVLYNTIKDLAIIQKTRDEIQDGLMQTINNALQGKTVIGGHYVGMNRKYEEMANFIKDNLSNSSGQIDKDSAININNISTIINSMLSIISAQQKNNKSRITQLFSTLGRSTRNIWNVLQTDNQVEKLTKDLDQTIELKTKKGTHKTSVMKLLVRDYAIATQQYPEKRNYLNFKTHIANSLIPNEALNKQTANEQAGIGIVTSIMRPTNTALQHKSVQQYEAMLVVFTNKGKNSTLEQSYENMIKEAETKNFNITTPNLQYSSATSKQKYEQKLKKTGNKQKHDAPLRKWTKEMTKERRNLQKLRR